MRFRFDAARHLGAHGAPARSGVGSGVPASDEPGFGAEPRQKKVPGLDLEKLEKLRDAISF
jgi:hypothetical protein